MPALLGDVKIRPNKIARIRHDELGIATYIYVCNLQETSTPLQHAGAEQ